MSYIINKSDKKTIVADIPDSTIDTHSTDLTLVGRDYSGYGKALNDNFVSLLENFASTSPVHPINGQLWYDSSELKLKVYNGFSFTAVSATTVSATQPPVLAIGDLWYNTNNKQLFFWDGIGASLVGPQFTEHQRLSGVKVMSV